MSAGTYYVTYPPTCRLKYHLIWQSRKYESKTAVTKSEIFPQVNFQVGEMEARKIHSHEIWILSFLCRDDNSELHVQRVECAASICSVQDWTNKIYWHTNSISVLVNWIVQKLLLICSVLFDLTFLDEPNLHAFKLISFYLMICIWSQSM